ncbi:hypothetical protein [Thalassospira sp. MCCC 1A01428]|uniref:hypothetical protein n=1 Tax=Thalassospira sp. MCCC 1A01428 TaxID=1470575 RepID=UPI000A1FEBAD|nr:hypothetical protein [Thalassospira sp. MCCC 1A01428]OSQ37082.1 hypothetical protein THS27_23000 [Thalassospira sp. MCCC 1A01428]
MVPELLLDSGRKIDPHRMRLTDIDMFEVARGLSRIRATLKGYPVVYSLARVALWRKAIGVDLTAPEKFPELESYLLLQDAWMYAFENFSIHALQALNPFCFDDLILAARHVRIKMMERFGISESSLSIHHHLQAEISVRLTSLIMSNRSSNLPEYSFLEDEQEFLTEFDMAQRQSFGCD